jgi:isopenicillin-N epimerase
VSTEPIPTQPPAVPAALANIRSQWMLRPDITFLNHGSFGAVPRKVFESQTQWRQRIEAEPVELLGRRGVELLDEAKHPLAQLLRMSIDDFGLVTNATEGINAVLRALPRERRDGRDELLTTTHVYNAVRKAMQFVAQRDGMSYREIHVPLPVSSADDIADYVIGGLSDRTRLLVIDHVTSPTALIFPVKQIAAECARRGIDVLIDGAHAPGMLGLDVPGIGATYSAANLHKWCCAPKGSGFLWVRRDRQKDVHPLIISHHLGEGFKAEFGWQGTRDVSAWLTIPAALQFMNELGWEPVRSHNHALATWANTMLSSRLKLANLSPLDGRLLGSMASLPLPPPLHTMSEAQIMQVQRKVYDEFRVEMPLMLWQENFYFRVSCQVYTTAQDLVRAGEVVEEITGPSAR